MPLRLGLEGLAAGLDLAAACQSSQLAKIPGLLLDASKNLTTTNTQLGPVPEGSYS